MKQLNNNYYYTTHLLLILLDEILILLFIIQKNMALYWLFQFISLFIKENLYEKRAIKTSAK